MNYWLTTDTHFGHYKLVEQGLRPEGFENKIFRSFKTNIKPDDTLIHFGDVCFHEDHEWHEKLNEIVCRKWLIAGNHDKRGISWYLNHGWDSVCESMALNIFGYKVLLSHIPQKDACYDINIHGHFHDTDHRRHEPEIAAILTYKHVLLALEYNHYQVWNMQSVVNNFKKNFQKVLDESLLPVKIQYQDNKQEIIVRSPYDIENGRTFTVVGTNVWL